MSEMLHLYDHRAFTVDELHDRCGLWDFPASIVKEANDSLPWDIEGVLNTDLLGFKDFTLYLEMRKLLAEWAVIGEDVSGSY